MRYCWAAIAFIRTPCFPIATERRNENENENGNAPSGVTLPKVKGKVMRWRTENLWTNKQITKLNAEEKETFLGHLLNSFFFSFLPSLICWNWISLDHSQNAFAQERNKNTFCFLSQLRWSYLIHLLQKRLSHILACPEMHTRSLSIYVIHNTGFCEFICGIKYMAIAGIRRYHARLCINGALCTLFCTPRAENCSRRKIEIESDVRHAMPAYIYIYYLFMCVL